MTASTFDKALKKETSSNLIYWSSVQKAKQEALKKWVIEHENYCNFCDSSVKCKTAQLTEKHFGSVEKP